MKGLSWLLVVYVLEGMVLPGFAEAANFPPPHERPSPLAAPPSASSAPASKPPAMAPRDEFFLQELAEHLRYEIPRDSARPDFLAKARKLIERLARNYRLGESWTKEALKVADAFWDQDHGAIRIEVNALASGLGLAPVVLRDALAARKQFFRGNRVEAFKALFASNGTPLDDAEVAILQKVQKDAQEGKRQLQAIYAHHGAKLSLAGGLDEEAQIAHLMDGSADALALPRKDYEALLRKTPALRDKLVPIYFIDRRGDFEQDDLQLELGANRHILVAPKGAFPADFAIDRAADRSKLAEVIRRDGIHVIASSTSADSLEALETLGVRNPKLQLNTQGLHDWLHKADRAHKSRIAYLDRSVFDWVAYRSGLGRRFQVLGETGSTGPSLVVIGNRARAESWKKARRFASAVSSFDPAYISEGLQFGLQGAKVIPADSPKIKESDPFVLEKGFHKPSTPGLTTGYLHSITSSPGSGFFSRTPDPTDYKWMYYEREPGTGKLVWTYPPGDEPIEYVGDRHEPEKSFYFIRRDNGKGEDSWIVVPSPVPYLRARGLLPPQG